MQRLHVALPAKETRLRRSTQCCSVADRLHEQLPPKENWLSSECVDQVKSNISMSACTVEDLCGYRPCCCIDDCNAGGLPNIAAMRASVMLICCAAACSSSWHGGESNLSKIDSSFTSLYTLIANCVVIPVDDYLWTGTHTCRQTTRGYRPIRNDSRAGA